ncbi:putative defensin-like protein 234 [Raphanus sativus]|uniref:Defensin-like protein 234 n=1 Tax=Raphanus sativus TaxID=3726 RepID=A0A6J0LNN4_RAPSA|nr:putative defensin-like protein 234 [Raphanus sativus]
MSNLILNYFLVSCILMFFIMNNVKDVEANLTPMGCGGSGKDLFMGGCGPDGNKTCINEFVKKRGEANRPDSCKCDEFSIQHLCLCNSNC